MEVIKAKLDGLTLESHINSVYKAATQFNNMLGTNFDNNLLYYFSILHDLGKANPILIESFRDKSIVFRHEISSHRRSSLRGCRDVNGTAQHDVRSPSPMCDWWWRHRA